MKPIALSTFTLFFILSVILTGCSNPSTPVEPQPPIETPETSAPTETPIPTASPAPTETPTPSATPVPTETPVPLPCNITFDSDRDGNIEIYVMDPDGNNLLNLTNNPADDWDPAWSPDGSQIAFVSNRENGEAGGQFIYVMNADGSGVRQLTTDPNSNFPDWSHDGSRITYTSNDDIYVIDTDGSGQPVNLTNSPEKDRSSTWAPDGSQIAWMSGDDRNLNVFVMNADGSHVQQLTDNGQVADVQWTVDGRIFTGWGWNDQQEYCHNCVVDPDGSNIVDAGGKGEVQRYLPFWTLDGDRVELAQVAVDGGDEEIYLVGEIYPDIFYNLTNNPANDRNPDWPANCGPGTE